MKFVFFLLAIALVSGVQSASVQTEVQEVQSKVQHRVQSVIDDVKKVFEAAREKAKKLRDELVVKSKEFFSKAEAQAREQYSKIEASFSDLWKRAGKINISQCKQVGQAFLDFGKGLFGTTKTCVDRTIDMGKSYMETLEELKKKIPASMSEFSNQAHACFDNKSERSDSKSIIECLKQLGSDWSERAADTATVVTQTVAKLGALVSEVVSDEMPKCIITDGMNFWKENSKTVHADIENCVNSAIKEWKKGK